MLAGLVVFFGDSKLAFHTCGAGTSASNIMGPKPNYIIQNWGASSAQTKSLDCPPSWVLLKSPPTWADARSWPIAPAIVSGATALCVT